MPPLMVRFRLLALPRVTPSKMGLLVAIRAWPLLLMMVPPKIPPLNTPPAKVAISSVLPVLSKVPDTTKLPPVLTMVAMDAAV